MVRLQPNTEYMAQIKSLKTSESKELKTTGSRLDWYMRHSDFLVTITSTASAPKYAPIDRKAGTKFQAEREQAKMKTTVEGEVTYIEEEDLNKDITPTVYSERRAS